MRGVHVDPERRETRRLFRHIPLEKGRVIEIGCGSGRLTRRVAGRIRWLVGVDINRQDMVKGHGLLPQRLHEHVRFAVSSADSLAFRDHSFDLALLSWSL
jgi:ubiquinone/menaquinone biosynthesis C-methylase UbiE